MADKIHRQLDCAVAEKVMGLRVVALDWPCGREPECGCYEAYLFHDADPEDGYLPSWYTERGPVYAPYEHGWPPCETDGYALVRPVPFYSTELADAWLVVEKLTDRFHWRLCSPFQPGQPWFAGITPLAVSGWNGRSDIEAGAETPAMSICLCALKAATLSRHGPSGPEESVEEVKGG